MKAFIFLILLLPLLAITGCAYNATTTLYKTETPITVSKIGFVNLTSDSISKENYQIINSTFCSSLQIIWQQSQTDSILFFDKSLSYYYPDTIEIARVCSSENIDGLILSSVELIHTTTYAFTGILFLPIPLGSYSSYDSQVKLKLFDKNGKLLISNSYYTRDAGKSQSKAAKTELVISDGVRGAVKGLVKEIKTRGYAFYQ